MATEVSLTQTLSKHNFSTPVENSTQAGAEGAQSVPAALTQASAAIRVAQRVVESYATLGDPEGEAYARDILQQWQAREAELQARLEASRQALGQKPAPTRRQFLAGVTILTGLAATAALPALPAQAASITNVIDNPPDDTSPEDDNRTLPSGPASCLCPSDGRGRRTQCWVPYPDPARLAVIDAWSWKIDKALTALESYWTYIRHSRYAAPVDVDGSELLTLGDKAINAMSKLVSLIENQEYNELVTAVTGKEDIYWLFKRSIDERDWPREVMAAELDKPDFDQDLAGEVKAYLEANWPA